MMIWGAEEGEEREKMLPLMKRVNSAVKFDLKLSRRKKAHEGDVVLQTKCLQCLLLEFLLHKVTHRIAVFVLFVILVASDSI